MALPRVVALSGMRFERLRMYDVAELLVAEVDAVLPHVGRAAPGRAEHLERSADSVVFNMAEGTACYKPKMKVAAYEIARKEANEVRAVLRRFVIKGTLTEQQISKAYDLAGACMGMLTKAIIAIERRPVK